MISRTTIGAAVAAALAVPAAGSAAESFREALGETKPLIDWRVRYEGVDQSGLPEQADALTSRLRLGFETGRAAGTSLLVEGVWLENAMDDYNDTVNGATQYPVVADRGGVAAVNRFAIVNRSLENAVLTIGRQRIIHADARFVGNVGWRQFEQTFDGARAEVGFGGSKLDLAYATQANRVFGPDSPAGKWEGDIVLARASHAFDWGTVALFGYLLDLDDAPAMSSDTYGIELVGATPIADGLTARYAVSYAAQSDAGRNPADFNEDFVRLEAGLAFGRATLDVGRETLGGNGVSAFSTPFATLHVFQGWVDKFLATPAAGIEDTYVEFGYAFGHVGPFSGLSLAAAYHDYGAEVGSATYGDEVNVQLVGKVSKMTFTLKYGNYAAETLFTDTSKLWVSMDYTF